MFIKRRPLLILIAVLSLAGFVGCSKKSAPAGKCTGNCTDGEGTLIRPDGFKYMGHWKGGKADGFGTAYMPEGDKAYEGEWKGNNYHGKGTEYLIDGRKYVGEFKNDKKDGEGVMYLPNGRVYYKGPWKDDNPLNPVAPNGLPDELPTPSKETPAI